MTEQPSPGHPARRSALAYGLLVGSAVLATATSAAGLTDLHRIGKPLVMLIAIFLVTHGHRVANPGNTAKASGPAPSGRNPLLIALTASLAGDVALMFDGFFVPGLVAFLFAHLAYIALFRRDVPWFSNRRALAMTLGMGGGMFAFLWAGGLPAGLRVPVAAYVLVIALMTAQAIGRASASGLPTARTAATGACLFMLSDALLATHRFVMPLPMAQLAVLSTYYGAQILIVDGWLRETSAGGRPFAPMNA